MNVFSLDDHELEPLAKILEQHRAALAKRKTFPTGETAGGVLLEMQVCERLASEIRFVHAQNAEPRPSRGDV